MTAVGEGRAGRRQVPALRLGLADFEVPAPQLLELGAQHLPFGGQEALAVSLRQFVETLGQRLAQPLRQFQGVHLLAQAAYERAARPPRQGGVQCVRQGFAKVFGGGHGVFNALILLASVRFPGGENLVALLSELPPQLLLRTVRRSAERTPALLQALGFGHFFGDAAVTGHQRLRLCQDVPLRRQIPLPVFFHFGVKLRLQLLKTRMEVLAFFAFSIDGMQGLPLLARGAHDALRRLHVRAAPIHAGHVGFELLADALPLLRVLFADLGLFGEVGAAGREGPFGGLIELGAQGPLLAVGGRPEPVPIVAQRLDAVGLVLGSDGRLRQVAHGLD